MARKMVWYSFNWSPKLRVTPLSETVFVAADALVVPRLEHERGGQAGREREGGDTTERGHRPPGWGRHQVHWTSFCGGGPGPPPGRRGWGIAGPAAVEPAA